jgi:hypothetical protein
LIWRKPACARETNIGESRFSPSEVTMKIFLAVDGSDELRGARVAGALT